ncbi:MAG: hypothetical protein AB1894_19130 [Chloroflexota bacterium]
MTKTRPSFLLPAAGTLLFTVLFLASCTMPMNYPTPTHANAGPVNPAYTAAAETIAAQLTELSSGAPLSTPQDVPETPSILITAADGTPTETLPATSTPLPTKTPLPSDTPTITLTPTITVTSTKGPVPSPTRAEPKAGLGDPTWEDPLDNANNWPLYTDGHVGMEIEDGKLAMTAFNPDGYEAMMFTWPILTNFYLEAEITTEACSGGDRYGLLARAPSFNPIQTYVFGLTCDGKYSLRIWDGARFVMLREWMANPAIKQGADQTNLLGFKAEGSSLSIFANDTLLAQVQDETFTAGYFGLFISANRTPSFTVQISYMAYWELP